MRSMRRKRSCRDKSSNSSAPLLRAVSGDLLTHLRSKSVVQRHRDMLTKCAERGVNIAFGTDAGNTYDPFDKAYYELVLMVEAGLTPEQAFTAASVGSAALMGISDRLGELAAGKDATFLCWADGDPFKNINYVTGKKHLILNGTRLY